MTKLLQTLLDSLAVGSQYALIALGYTMVYGILSFINFAHSDVFMAGAWVSFLTAKAAGWAGQGAPLWSVALVLVAAMVACAALGYTIERLAYRPLRRAPRLNVLITAIGVSLFLENTGQLKFIFGTQPGSMPQLLPTTPLATIAGVHIHYVDVALVVGSLALMAALQWLVYGTKLGRAMRAVSYNDRVAALMGVNVDAVVSITFVIGSALAGAAGLMQAIKYPTVKQSADIGWALLGLKAFVAAVVGGIGNVRGAMLGGLLIGFVEQFGAGYVSTHLRDVFVFALLIGVLLLKPTGILGKAVPEKV